ncbi:hypothetical protein D3C76_1415270 [compost metagenome]
MNQVQRDATFRLVADSHFVALFTQFCGDFFAGRFNHFFNEPAHVDPARHHRDVAQPALPAALGLLGKAVTQATASGVQVQGLEQPPDRCQQDDREGQRGGNGSGLQGFEAIGEQQGDRHHANTHRPEYALP